MRSAGKAPLCWLCFLLGWNTRLDAESQCPHHGLVKDRLLGIVQVDTRLLKEKA